uniref:Uncharacterized protein n=1 Tax=Anguilla anguilla TaxID=7936 RepID=A0A0E9TU46_ANGAN
MFKFMNVLCCTTLPALLKVCCFYVRRPGVKNRYSV